MAENIKQQAIDGAKWAAIEKFSLQGIQQNYACSILKQNNRLSSNKSGLSTKCIVRMY